MTGRRISFYCALAMLGLCTPIALGDDTWDDVGGPCQDITESQIVFCENFDTYCTGGSTWTGYPPVYPPGMTYCADGTSTPDDAAYLANWLKPFDCGVVTPPPYVEGYAPPYPPALDRTHIAEEVGGQQSGGLRDYNPPFSLRYEGCLYNYEDPNLCGSLPYNLSSSRHEMSLTDAIDDQWPGSTMINGTDQVPIRMKFHLDHMTRDDAPHRGGDSANANFYVELCKDDDRAPTDFIWKDCHGTTTEGVFPVICQQYLRDQTVPPGELANCPPMSTEVHASIAVGMLAIMDNYPCDTENGSRPTNYHLSVFDGLKWWDLREGMFPGSGDFALNDGGDSYVEMEVRGTYLYIHFVWEHCCVDGGPYDPCYDSENAWCIYYGGKQIIENEAVMPRVYVGPFNKIAFGMGEGCELNQNEHTCYGSDGCFQYGSFNDGWGWGHTWLDALVVYDGVGDVVPAPPEVETAVSWKNHTFVSDFGIDVLNRTGNADIESRRDGVTKLVVNFDCNIQGVDGLDTSDVSLTSGTVTSITLSAADELTITTVNTLNYVGSGSIPLTVSFPGIANAGDVTKVCTDTVCVRQLVGNASYTDTYISSSDLVRVRDVMSQLCTADTFRRDIYNDGYFSSSDLVQIRNRMSTYINGTCP